MLDVATPERLSEDQLFRALIENSSDIITIIDSEGIVRYESPSVQRYLGHRAEDLIGRSAWELVHPDDREPVRRAFGERLRNPGVVQTTRYRVRHLDGSWRVLEATGTNRTDDPMVAGVVVNSRDITDRVRAEASLHASNDSLRALIEAAPQAVIALDSAGCVTLWNEAAERIFGWSEAEVLGRPLPYVPGEAEEEHRRLRERVLLGGEALTGVEVIRVRRDGSRFLLSISTAPLRDADGRICGVMSLCSDITEQKRAEVAHQASEEVLARSEARFRALTENSSDVITLLGPDGTILYESQSVGLVLGYAPDELVGRQVFEVIHPEDLPTVLSVFEQVAREPGVTLDVSFRFRHRDGTWRFLETRGTNLLHDPAIGGIVANSRDVTDRRATEELNRRLATIVETSSDAIISKQLDGTILSWNEAAERIYGYSAAEMVGRSISLLIPPELDSEEASIVFRLVRGERIQNHETVRVRKDGRRIQVSLTISPIPDEDGGVGSASIIARDISDRKRAETELRAGNERYRLAGRATKDVIWDCDLAEETIEWGDSIHTTFGYAPGEVRNDVIWWVERVHPDDLDEVATSASEFLRGSDEAWSCEYRFRRSDGSYATVLDRGYVIRSAAGAPLRMIGSKSDITERREAEEALRQAKEAAEAASRSKSEFLSSMSHELRTPLNSVIGFTNVLRKNRAGNLRQQDQAYLERIHANGMHLLGLINDILDLSKIEAGKMEVQAEPVALDALIQETLAELQGNVRPGVELRTEVPAAPALVETDARKLKQILINLVGNALKFTEAGSVTVALETRTADGRPARMVVRDTGVGIPAERLSAIFDAFEQGEGGTARRFGGTGLGLAICSSLSRLMGYRIEVQSEPGMGSVFSIVLDSPSAPPAPEAPRADAGSALLEEPTGAAMGEFRGRRVLVIDDEADSRFVLAEALSEHGCEVATAASGEQGVRMAREFRPHLITLDLIMPEVSGWDTLQALKDDPELCEIPVVVVSVLAEEQRGRLFGPVDLLSKPAQRRELQSVLRRNLGDRAGRILVVDDQEDARLLIAAAVREEGVEIRTAGSGPEALNVLQGYTPDLIFLDLLMPGMDGVQFLARLREERRDLLPSIVVVTGTDPTRAELERLRGEVSAVIGKDGGLEEELRRQIREVWSRRA